MPNYRAAKSQAPDRGQREEQKTQAESSWKEGSHTRICNNPAEAKPKVQKDETGRLSEWDEKEGLYQALMKQCVKLRTQQGQPGHRGYMIRRSSILGLHGATLLTENSVQATEDIKHSDKLESLCAKKQTENT